MGRITVNGTISQFSCKLNIRPVLWDTQSNKDSGKSVEAQQINEKLENIKTNIGKHHQHIATKKNHCNSTVWSYMMPFRKIIYMAVKNGLL